MKKKKKWIKRSIIILVVVGIVGAVVYSMSHRPPDMGYDSEVAKTGEITTYYSFSGNIVAEKKRQMLAEGSYKITRFHVKEGDVVKSGDVLYEIDNSTMQTNLDQAMASLRVAQANYDNTKNSGTPQQILAAENALQSAQLNYDNAGSGAAKAQLVSAQSAIDTAKLNLDSIKDALEKTKILYSEGIIAKNELDKSQAAYDLALSQYNTALESYDIAKETVDSAIATAKVQLDQAKSNYNFIKNTAASSNLETAKAQLDQAKSSYDSVKEQMTSSKVTAKIAGEITKVYADVDTTVMAGSPVLDLVDYSSLCAEVKVDEYDVGALPAGKPVTVTINALSRDVSGKVLRLTQETDKVKNISYFVSKISLPKDPALLEGMSVEAKALNQSAYKVTTISMKALQFNNENKPYINVMGEDQKIIERPVKIGINDGLTVEIKEGLKAGETVYYSKQIAASPMESESTSSSTSSGGEE